MKVFANREIKDLFAKLFLCLFIFIAAAAVGIFSPITNKTVYLLIISLLLFAAFLIILYVYFINENKRLEQAVASIQDYMAGNAEARIPCNEEGELYRLFHEVNMLVSILNARAENEMEKKNFLKETISNISHQLKTPLAALNIYNGILQEAEELQTVQEFSAQSEQELERIEVLVQNLLKIAKLDAGSIVFEKRPENIMELMKGVEKHFSFRAGEEQKKLVLKGDTTIELCCDRGWMTEAIENIVKNGLDHTKAGGHIFIEWGKRGSMVKIIIKDDGCGIHPEDMLFIFKRFYRSRFSKDTQGVGLGLPLAKAIVEAHNGTIEVVSKKNIGTTFYLNFLIPTKL